MPSGMVDSYWLNKIVNLDNFILDNSIYDLLIAQEFIAIPRLDPKKQGHTTRAIPS
jgi:hypothetical protein